MTLQGDTQQTVPLEPTEARAGARYSIILKPFEWSTRTTENSWTQRIYRNLVLMLGEKLKNMKIVKENSNTCAQYIVCKLYKYLVRY